MQVAVRMWQGQKVPPARGITVDLAHTPDGYALHLADVLPLLATGGPRGIILGLFLHETIKLNDRGLPQFVQLSLAEPLSIHEASASLIRSRQSERVRLREHCQVNTFLKVVRDIRSGQVSRVRASHPPRSQEEGKQGSIPEQAKPSQRFTSRRRPGEP